jgi:oxygen-independent coproporphyrinogen-3 oxidase
MQECADISQMDPELIRRFDRNGPRYTSYPTADRFVEAYDGPAHAGWLANRNVGGIVQPLSVYVHLPFCVSLCYYCACNKVITRDHGRSAKYLRYLGKELHLLSGHLQGSRQITQLHWGGGTPTFLSRNEMGELMDLLRSHFDFAADGEYAIEIDPRTVDADAIRFLAGLGFNRMSLGVQDYDPDVQRAIHRVQPAALVRDALSAARDNGFQSVNFDLIYGLPKQTLEGFSRTLDEVIAERPDRIALYSYAHLPSRFKAQRRIGDHALPDADTKLRLQLLAVRRFTEAGYVHIGMDHFALPDDELAQALRSGRLHRNFQGYTTQAECDLLSLGVSAISKIGPSYSQNLHGLDDYYDSLDHGQLPVARGIELSPDDLVRRAVIMGLMCQGEVSFESIETAHLIDFRTYFATELERLAQYEEAGLLECDGQSINVTGLGRHFLRGISMTFDRYLQSGQARGQFSRLI